jgi:hypothetical protein
MFDATEEEIDMDARQTKDSTPALPVRNPLTPQQEAWLDANVFTARDLRDRFAS